MKKNLHSVSCHLPGSANLQSWQDSVLAVYPPSELTAYLVLALPAADALQQRAALQRLNAQVEGKVHQRVKLPLRLAYAQLVHRLFHGDKVGLQQRRRLPFCDFHPLRHAVRMAVADGPHPGGALVCLEPQPLKLLDCVQRVPAYSHCLHVLS